MGVPVFLCFFRYEGIEIGRPASVTRGTGIKVRTCPDPTIAHPHIFRLAGGIDFELPRNPDAAVGNCKAVDHNDDALISIHGSAIIIKHSSPPVESPVRMPLSGIVP